MENNHDYRGDITGITVNETKPYYRCVIGNETMDIGENGELLYNDQPVVTLEDHKNVLRLLLKGLVHSVQR